jgi:hypothetical protein
VPPELWCGYDTMLLIDMPAATLLSAKVRAMFPASLFACPVFVLRLRVRLHHAVTFDLADMDRPLAIGGTASRGGAGGRRQLPPGTRAAGIVVRL